MDENTSGENVKPKIIGITGSAGKTTTKEMIAAILRKKGKLFKTKYNLNLPIHTETYAKQIVSDHYAVVLELALSKPGDIAKHCEIIKPDIGVITNIGTAHIGQFGGSVKELAKAKGEIISGMNTKGMLVYNADDPNSKYLSTKKFKGTIRTVGINNPADYQAFNVQYNDKGMSFEIKLDEEIHLFQINVYGIHNIYNALSAIAVSHHLGFSIDEMKKGLKAFFRPQRRLTVSSFTNDIQLIDDSFSSNPHALRAAIDVLHKLGEKKLKVAVLGSMLELGEKSAQEHINIGKYIKEKQIDYLLIYGKAAKYIGKGALSSGFPRENITHFSTKDKLNRYLVENIQPNSVILIKGSHRLEMYKTVIFVKSHLRNLN